MKIWGHIDRVDILAIGVHPDDVELSCCGTLLKEIDAGAKVGILDLTEGELGTRGSRDIRRAEAFEAADSMGADFRVILDLGDGFFTGGAEDQLQIIAMIRACTPRTILCNAISDRHSDHGRAAKLVSDAAYLSGLKKVETSHSGKLQAPWRARTLLHYIQDYMRVPDIVIETGHFHDKKMEVIRKFRSQFYNPDSNEPDSPISGKEFLDFVEAKSRVMGRYIQVEHAEGFESPRPLGVARLSELL